MVADSYIILPDKMGDAMSIGALHKSFDINMRTIEKFCGNDNVFRLKGDVCALDEMSVCYGDLLDWPKDYFLDKINVSFNDDSCAKPAICKLNGYIQTISDNDLEECISFLDRFMTNGGVVILDNRRIETRNDLMWKIASDRNMQIGYLYITDSFKKKITCFCPAIVDWVINDFAKSINTVYDDLGVYPCPIWDITSYIDNNFRMTVHPCYRNPVIHDFVKNGGIVIYRNVRYNDLNKLKKVIP